MTFWLWMEKHLESSISRKELPLDWMSFKGFMATITLSWENLFWLRLQLISLLILSYLCNSKFQNYQWNKLVLFKYCHQFLKNEQNEGHKRAKRHNSIKLYNYFTFFRNVDSFFKHNAFLFMACNKHLKVNTVFKNHRKSLIQHSELHLHFEWTKVH